MSVCIPEMVVLGCEYSIKPRHTPSKTTTQSNMKPEHPGTRSLDISRGECLRISVFRLKAGHDVYSHNLQINCAVKEIPLPGNDPRVGGADLMCI